jgi:alkylhydroperoxidase family enzyme
MARLPIVDPNDPDADAAAVDVLRRVSGRSGRTVPRNVWATMANHPRALDKVADLARVVYFANSMTPAQRELAYLTASVTNDCHY